MPEVLAQRLGGMSVPNDEYQLRVLLAALIDGIRVITAKLDADATVTDTNYTAVFDAVITK